MFPSHSCKCKALIALLLAVALLSAACAPTETPSLPAAPETLTAATATPADTPPTSAAGMEPTPTAPPKPTADAPTATADVAPTPPNPDITPSVTPAGKSEVTKSSLAAWEGGTAPAGYEGWKVTSKTENTAVIEKAITMNGVSYRINHLLTFTGDKVTREDGYISANGVTFIIDQAFREGIAEFAFSNDLSQFAKIREFINKYAGLETTASTPIVYHIEVYHSSPTTMRSDRAPQLGSDGAIHIHFGISKIDSWKNDGSPTVWAQQISTSPELAADPLSASKPYKNKQYKEAYDAVLLLNPPNFQGTFTLVKD